MAHDSHGRMESTMLFRDDFIYSEKCWHYSALYEQCEKNILEEFSKIVKKPTTSVITIADFGTADGKMVTPTLNKLIDMVNKNSEPMREIMIYFEDQPCNDFNVLCKTVRGIKEGQNGLKVDSKNVFWSVVSTSMYNRCFPRDTLDFALCFACIHWLSRRVTTITEGTDQSQANMVELQLLQQQSAEDWVHFLNARAKELKAGGVLFVCCLIKKGKEGECNMGGRQVDIFSIVLRDLRAEHVISDTEFEEINFDWYSRTREEFERPFQDDTMKNAGLKLKLVKINNGSVIPPLDVQQKEDPIRRRQQARSIAETMKACTFNAVFYGLSKQRSDTERTRIAELYFKKMEEYLFENKNAQLTFNWVEIIIQKDV